MKTIAAVLFVILIRSCNAVDSGSDSALHIQTEHQSYTVTGKLSVKTTFENHLGKEIVILNAGCGFPQFVLERFENNQWSVSGGPVCVALAVAPTRLGNGEKFETVVGMYAEEQVTTGTYRMKFHIRLDDGKTLLDEKYLYSNSFQIVRL